MEIQIKVCKVTSTFQAMDYAVDAGAEGFVFIMEVENDDEQIFVFSKQSFYCNALREKIESVIKEGYDIGDTFLFVDEYYEIIA